MDRMFGVYRTARNEPSALNEEMLVALSGQPV
jgi:hypothetical protein